MPRKYHKKSEYWTNRNPQMVENTVVASERVEMPNLEYEIAASFGDGEPNVATRGMVQNTTLDSNKFQNLRACALPFENSNGRYSINQAIELTQKAYANVSIFRNAVEVLTEFANSPIHLKGGNAKSREFVKAWFKRIGIENLADQYFREYHLSGNVFMYQFNGKLRDGDIKKIKESMGGRATKIPIRYIVLNPTNVFVESGFSSQNYNYVKMLSLYEIQRLKNPQTDDEKEMFNSLPELVRKQIKSYTGGVATFIYVPIDPMRLHYVFYKKQSYQPLAIPMGYPVLQDIEWKLQLKKMDMAMSRSVEHAILLITTGEKVDQFGGGVNPNNVAKLQKLFKTPTIGRVLVADYTTKAQWAIPDFEELLGPKKYEVVDRDIKEGLQTILIGEDKFANAVLKAKVFMERLKSSQASFINGFLQSEINRVCEEVGFKATPTAVFEGVDLEDKVQTQKIYLRLAELGLLTPQQANDAMETGILPDKEGLDEAQVEYKSQRDKGFYYPLVGGGNVPKNAVLAPPVPAGKIGAPGSGGRPAGSKAPQTTKKVKPIGSKGGDRFSTLKIINLMNQLDSLKNDSAAALKEKFKVDELSAEQLEIAESLAKSIFINEENDKWKESISSYLDNPKEINPEIADEMDEIAIKYDLDSEMCAILSKARV